MDTEKCAVLLKVLETGSLSGAADALGYTPSGVSRMMASLESELGFPLMFRSKAGVSATPDCERMLPVLKELAALGQTCEQTASYIRGVEMGTVRVGCAYPQLYGPLARCIASFGHEHPGVQIDLVQANSSPLARQLEAREVDLCIISRREIDCTWVELLSNQMVVVIPLDHELAVADPSISQGQTGAYPLERLAIDPFIDVAPADESDHSLVLAAHGVQPNVRYTVQNADAAFELVSAGLGVTLINGIHACEWSQQSQRAQLPEGVKVLPCDPTIPVEIGIATPPTSQAQSPAARAFADFAIPRLRA